MWQLGKKLLRLTERLHFGELNQLNGCGRAESGEGSWMRPPGWRALRKRPQFLLPRLNLLSFFLLYWCRSDPSLPLSHFSKSIFSLKCSAFSRFSTFSSLFLFFPFGQITFSSSAHTLTYSFFFPQTLDGRQTDRQTDTQPVRVRWDKAGHDLGDTFRCPAVKAEAISWAYE